MRFAKTVSGALAYECNCRLHCDDEDVAIRDSYIQAASLAISKHVETKLKLPCCFVVFVLQTNAGMGATVLILGQPLMSLVRNTLLSWSNGRQNPPMQTYGTQPTVQASPGR